MKEERLKNSPSLIRQFSKKMRPYIFILFLLVLTVANSFAADQPLEFTNIIKATLVFKEESNSYPDYPHKLLVYLCLENRHDSSVYWYCNSVLDVETDLLDSNGKPVPQTGGFASVPSNAETYLLPYHSRLEWMLNHGGVTMLGEAKDKYALVVGSRSWLIPTNSFSSYSLRVRVRGWPWSDHAPPGAPRGKVFFEVPPTQLVIK